MIKVALDGTLFSECYLRGANRDGMMRLTEDITKYLVNDYKLDISFVSNYFLQQYDAALKNFVEENYSSHIDKIITKNPPVFTNVFKWKGLYKSKLSNLLNPSYKSLNKQDIFHSFYYPFQKNISDIKIKKTITYLDIIPLMLKGYPQELVQRTSAIVDSIKKGYAISISEYSKTDLLNYDKRINEENVFVVPLAASANLFYKNINIADWQRVKEKYNLPDHYFLSVSGNDSRKNIPHLVECFNQFVLQEKHNDLFLVLTGNGSHNRSMLDKINIKKEVKDKIFISDTFIDSEDLAVLYSNAICFFFMSLYEGFGLPALEAMQCGVPVVTSNTTSLPEVVGNAGFTVSPTNVNDLAEVMSKLYHDAALRNEYADKALQRAATFSWERCAKEYTEIFTLVHSKK